MKTLTSFILLLSLGLISCSREPEPIIYGKDACEHCKMTIMDSKFGAEIVTSKGRIHKFDAIECMVDFLKDNPERINNSKDMHLAIDVAAPGNLINARNAFFLKDEAFKSPMGGNLAAFNSRQLAENNLQTADGEVLTWEELLKIK